MSNICTPNKSLVDMGINVTLHMAILFLILGMAFVFYISKVIKEHTETELSHLMKDSIKESLDTLSIDKQKQLKKSINSINLERVLRYYDQEDKTVKAHNAWLFNTIVLITVFLFIIVTFITLTSNSLCSHVNIKHMLLENIIIFAGIGVIELTFFQLIALNYVPIPPSLISTHLIDSLKKTLAN